MERGGGVSMCERKTLPVSRKPLSPTALCTGRQRAVPGSNWLCIPLQKAGSAALKDTCLNS